MTAPRGTPDGAERQGEVVISGVDTGPDNHERGNLTPTEQEELFLPADHPTEEPEDEDG